MIDMSYYRKIQNAHGSNSVQEAQINSIKTLLNKDFYNTLDVFTVSINGVNQDLTILKTTNATRKKIKSKPNQTFNIGDYIQWMNDYWIVTEADIDERFYASGKMERCNYLLKWQNGEGTIIERHAIVLSASKYNDGETGNNIITLGSDQLSVQIPIDNESLHIKRKTKFFIDNNSENPTVYELTGTGNVVDTYNGHGVTSWIVKECAYSPTANDLLYGVCDYFTPTTPSVPSDTWNMLMICNNYNLRIGGSPKTITGQLVDSNGNNLECTYVWTITGDYASSMITTITDNVLVIAAPDSIEENTTITISVASKHTGQVAEQVFSVELGV